MELKQVKEFNREKSAKYDQAVKDWNFLKGGFPYRPMFVYVDEYTGKDRQKGWVLLWDGSTMLFKNRASALDFAKKNNIA